MSSTSHAQELQAAPALIPPEIMTSPAARYSMAEQNYGMTIGMERTPGGRLWACWVGGGDSEKAFFALASSDDDGATWSDTRVVIDPHDPQLPLARRSLVGNLWTDPQGRLWLLFDQAMTFFDGRGGAWATRCDNPDDDEPQWDTPRRLWHGCSLIKPTVLGNGEWLLPASLWDRDKVSATFCESFHDLDLLRGVNVLVSANQGETWERRGGATFPHPDFDEANLIERKDGTLWMTARTMDLDVWESFSVDNGHTWSEPGPSAIKNVNSRHFMRRLASGRVLLIKNGPRVDERTSLEKPYTGRRELTAFLSEDEGKTWLGGLVIDEREPVTYPDGTQAPDGRIYISYDHARETLSNILMAKFREEDILAGRLVSPDSGLKIPIFSPRKGRDAA